MNNVKWLVLAIIILLSLFILFLCTKLTIFVYYYHHKDDDHITIEFRAWFGLIRYRKVIPLIKVSDQTAGIIVKEKSDKGQNQREENNERNFTATEVLNSLKNYREILEHVIHLNKIMRRFCKKVAIKQFEWHSVIGVGDAAHTGTASGILWAVKGSIIGLLSHYLSMKTIPKITVQPRFQQIITQTNLSCMIQFRIGHAIVAGLKIVKLWKGGKPLLRTNTITSNVKPKSI